MKPSDIESWALRVIDRVEKGQTIENCMEMAIHVA